MMRTTTNYGQRAPKRLTDEEIISYIEAEIRFFQEFPNHVQHDESAKLLVRWSTLYPDLYQVAQRLVQEIPC